MTSLKMLLRGLGLGCWLAALAGGSGGLAAEFQGQLNPRVETGKRVMAPLIPASAGLAARLPVAPGPAEQVWMLPRPFKIKEMTRDLALVMTPGGAARLWIDRNQDGTFGLDEVWTLPTDGKAVDFDLPWNNGIFREFPFRVVLYPEGVNPDDKRPALLYTFNVVFQASVAVDGRPLQITFHPAPDDSAIDLSTTRLAVDANFNGQIEDSLGEVESPTDKPAIFRVGPRYLAIKSVSVATGQVVLEERPAAEYTRFDANPGQEVPEFSFVTLEGEKHQLADFRGKYVLLDFWGTWCGPCINEMERLDPLYTKYHPRGFEVIGMNMEKTRGSLSAEAYADDVAKVRAFIAKAGHRWLQATQQSIERFALDVIHVNAYPTCILIGPDGKVISREARGETLEKLLESIFP